MCYPPRPMKRAALAYADDRERLNKVQPEVPGQGLHGDTVTIEGRIASVSEKGFVELEEVFIRDTSLDVPVRK